MMTVDKRFVMHTDWLEMIEELDDSGRSELLLAIMRYQSSVDIPENMSEGARVAFAIIKNQFWRDHRLESIVHSVQKDSTDESENQSNISPHLKTNGKGPSKTS